MAPLQILVVEDDENDVILLQKELRAGGLVFDSRVVDAQAAFVQALDEFKPDLIIADFRLPRFDALTALELTQSRTRRTPFIIFTGCLDEATAVLCMKLGAWDYVLKQNPVRLVSCIRAALERRRLVEEKEQAVRESEVRFRRLADIAPSLIWMTDPAGRFQYFNQAWLAFRGRTEDEERDRGWMDGLHPEDRPRIEHALVNKLATLQPCEIEFRLRRHDGAWRWLLCRAAPYYTGRDAFAGYVGAAIDVSERKEAETSLARGVELARALVPHLPGPAFLKDAAGRYVAANGPAAALLGRTAAELAGRTDDELGEGGAAPALRAAERSVRENGRPENVRVEAPGAPAGGWAFTVWPTETGVLAAAAPAPGTIPLPSAIRHELNNLLSVVRMYAEFLGEHPALDPRLVDKARQIVDAADRINDILRALQGLPPLGGAAGQRP